MPRFVTGLCLIPLESTIKEKTGFDALDNSPLDLASKIKVPSFVMVATQDVVTRPERVKEVFDAIPGNM